MSKRIASIFILSLLTVACTKPAPSWRDDALLLIEDLEKKSANKIFPQEFQSILETFEHGDAILHVRKDEKLSDEQYLFVIQKSDVISKKLADYMRKIEEDNRRKAFEAAKALKEEELLKEAKEAEERLHNLEIEEEKSVKNQFASDSKLKKIAEPIKKVTTYSVKRGETLPQIAARADVYNDSSLWAVIYRANRDQIRDPKRLWPGQVLTIPRGKKK